ncbi:MAG: thioredoxin [Alistipes sp.]|nr:thioredoxin [Alistipes sp.]
MALQITNENYEALIADSKPLVIDFWAEWCGPCRTIAPLVEEFAETYADKVNIGKCDVDSSDDVVAVYRVRNIPTLVFIKNGEVVDKHVGAISRNDLQAKIEALL